MIFEAINPRFRFLSSLFNCVYAKIKFYGVGLPPTVTERHVIAQIDNKIERPLPSSGL